MDSQDPQPQTVVAELSRDCVLQPPVPELASTEIHIWEFRVTISDSEFGKHAALRSEDERTCSSRFRFERDSRRFALLEMRRNVCRKLQPLLLRFWGKQGLGVRKNLHIIPVGTLFRRVNRSLTFILINLQYNGKSLCGMALARSQEVSVFRVYTGINLGHRPTTKNL